MEPFLILLMAVSLVVSAFATPLAVAHREISGGNTTEFVDIPTQTYTGEGWSTGHCFQVIFNSNESPLYQVSTTMLME